jgi:hypothetical protein
VSVSSETRYLEVIRKGDRQAASLADIHTGARFLAVGSWDKNGSFDATVVLFHDRDGNR